MRRPSGRGGASLRAYWTAPVRTASKRNDVMAINVVKMTGKRNGCPERQQSRLRFTRHASRSEKWS